MDAVCWIAAHTGLPSFYIQGPATLRTAQRTIVTVPSGKRTLVSDALAAPGADTRYEVGGAVVSLTRAAAVDPSAVVTDAFGRGVPGLRHIDNGVPVDWKSDVSRFNERSARWPLHPNPDTGTGVVVSTDAGREASLWQLLKSRGAIIIAPALPTPGVPMRCVTVDSVSRQLFSPNGWLRLAISWTELAGVSGAAPVVTWAEWAALGQGWQSRSALEVAQVVAGMPA